VAAFDAQLGARLLEWYGVAKREMPWRATLDPYLIWISEVILQQTRVQQGWAYYERFVVRFPTVGALAAASEDEVLKQWEGLGYYARARNLRQAAQAVVSEHGGQFPRTAAGLMQLRGIGPYTARAVASLAFGESVAVVDGNVFRVLSRLFADGTPIDSSRAREHYQALADGLLGVHPPGEFNQAMMELGALVCTPRAPLCTQCPLRADCAAANAGNPLDYPVKQKKAARPTRLFDARWVRDAQGRIVVRQRPSSGTGVWRGLWELPNTEVIAFKKHSHERLRLRHAFSHYEMQLRIIEIEPSEYSLSENDHWVSPDELRTLAFGRAYTRAFEALLVPTLLS
jgi:A/G-specific adenine glycosylase